MTPLGKTVTGTEQGGRPSDRAVQLAMWKWRGKVVAAADELGIGRNRLYERLKAMNKSPNDFRKPSDAPGSTDSPGILDKPDMSGRIAVASSESGGGGGGVRNSSGDPSCPPPSIRNFRPVASTPIAAAPRPKQIRILPEHEDLIRRARRKISFALDRDLSDEACLADFISEALEPWLEGKLGVVEKKGKAAKG